MRLLSCKNPKRVYNKYIDDYIFVPCGECAICKNRKAAHFTSLLERERSQHRYTFFVTLTYDDAHLPFLHGGFNDPDYRLNEYFPSRSRDDFRILFSDLFPSKKSECYTQADIDFFDAWFANTPDNKYHGLPYASKTDAQLFLKRLNKHAHDDYTSTFKNFRYFLVSEYGSTTFRPHFHIIFFVDNDRFAEGFKDCVLASWKYGTIDSQLVESSACSYVSQYLNKSPDLPYVYQNCFLRPFYLCSRNPFIGSFTECPEVDKEVVDNSSVTTFVCGKNDTATYACVPLQQSYQNRLFPKCPLYGTIPNSFRIEFYGLFKRFRSESLKDFINSVYDYISSYCNTDFCCYLRSLLTYSDIKGLMFDFDHRQPYHLFSKSSFEFLRRLYYFGRKIARQACQFGYSVIEYTNKILSYWDKKELYLLKEFYSFQEEVSVIEVESVALMYPDFLFKNNIAYQDYINDMDCQLAKIQIFDADILYKSNKKTHFKNAYLDSLRLKAGCKFTFNLIKNYLYGKKCNETLEAFAS